MGRLGASAPGEADNQKPKVADRLVGQVTTIDDAGQIFVRDQSGRERLVDHSSELVTRDRQGKLLVFGRKRTETGSFAQEPSEALHELIAPPVDAQGNPLRVGGILPLARDMSTGKFQLALPGAARETLGGLINLMEAGRTATHPEDVRPADAMAVPVTGTAIGTLTRSVPKGAVGMFGLRPYTPGEVPRSKIAPKLEVVGDETGMTFTGKFDSGDIIDIDFMMEGGLKPGGKAKVLFTINDEFDPEDAQLKSESPISAKVFGAIQNSMIDFIEQTRPDRIEFNALSDELNKLYRMALPRFARAFGGKAVFGKDPNSGKDVFILDLSKSPFR